MITPRKVFLSFMLMIAILPVPILNSGLAFTMTWAVLGFKKAVLVLAASMAYNIMLSLTFMLQLWASLSSAIEQTIQASQSCVDYCTPVPFSATPIFQLLKADELGLSIAAGMSVYSFSQLYMRMRKIRAYSGSIKKFYWGPER